MYCIIAHANYESILVIDIAFIIGPRIGWPIPEIITRVRSTK